ncbi:Membrane-associated 30 kDa protein [Hibiscus syriacus]|uniref:Membrane-associated 30 kDa protein n=1 Tax=Hibiscus syriacus TaxID=106335 RepID=A0A6A2ZJC2_HIBSY|nr:Membrane-associated 30 kDa protein [Hibiscus syriacus]
MFTTAVKSHIITGLTLPLKPTAPAFSSSGTGSSLCLVKKPLISSFFNGVVASLKTSSIRTLPGRSHRYRQGGGALGTRMNLFDRFARVVKSYANALLSFFEDPEKILDQAVLEMNDDLVKMRQATAQLSSSLWKDILQLTGLQRSPLSWDNLLSWACATWKASQKRLENKYKAAQQAFEDWYRKAQLALQKGEEGLAREALKRRKSLDLLESKIQEAKSKKDTLKARAQSARTATKINEMVGNVSTSSALAALRRWKRKRNMVKVIDTNSSETAQEVTMNEGNYSSSMDDLQNGRGKLSHLLGSGPKEDPRFDAWDKQDSLCIQMRCKEDATILKRFVEKDQIYDFLAGLNIEFDAVRVQILGKEDLSSLNEVIAIIRAQEGRRGVMIEHSQVESSALITRTVTERKIGIEQSINEDNRHTEEGEADLTCKYSIPFLLLGTYV